MISATSRWRACSRSCRRHSRQPRCSGRPRDRRSARHRRRSTCRNSLAASGFAGALAQQEAVDGCVDRASRRRTRCRASGTGRSRCRPRRRVSFAACAANVPRKYMPASPARQLRRRVLPRLADAAVGVEGRSSLHFSKTALTRRIGPTLVAGHQVDVELVPVEAHVEDVEGAHGRPALEVAERERDEPVGLHLLGEGDELLPRRRDRRSPRSSKTLSR